MRNGDGPPAAGEDGGSAAVSLRSGGPRMIAVEGVIGAGKTTLARLLAQRLGGRVVEELAEENPFLSRFYRDRRAFAFQTQVFFLLSRFQQQQELAQPDLFRRAAVSDYLFDKDRIFAHLNLDDQELALYEKLYGLLEDQVPLPDLAIYLQASTDVLLHRIRLRARPFEKAMPREYVEDLNQAYNRYFFAFDRAPLLIVNTNDVDFTKSEADVDRLLRLVSETRGGVQYYVPPR